MIRAIIDWEYAGFYPPFFDGRFYRRPGPSCTLEKFDELSDTSKLVDFFESRQIKQPDIQEPSVKKSV